MIKTKKYKASEIAKIVNGELIGNDFSIEFISFNSKETSKTPFLFIPLKGERFDAENFVDEAVDNGAKIVLSSKKRKLNVSLIYVEDTKKALYKLAEHNKGDTKIIGITGSNGKTTVKEMVLSVLSQKYKACGTKENHNNEIGVSQTLLSITDEDFCVVEMGMRGLGEIDFLAKLSKPYISIVTNIGRAHIERLKNENNIFLAKSEILKYTPKYAIVPGEKRFKKILKKTTIPVFIGRYGDLKIGKIKRENSGIKYEIIDKNLNRKYSAQIHSMYKHDLKNSLIAFSVGKICKIDPKMILKGIFEFENLKNRGSIEKIGKFTIINDSYNSSYESLKCAILGALELANFENKRTILVLGDMLELGDFSEKIHHKIGDFSRKMGVFNIVAMGKFSSFICKGFRGGEICNSTCEIVEYIMKNVGEKDIILIKASRALHFEKILEGLKEKYDEN